MATIAHDTEKLAKIKDQVAKLMAKAEGTDNPEEAKTFLAAAQERMMKWAITEADIRKAQGDAAETLKGVRVDWNYTGPKTYWRNLVHNATALVNQAIGMCEVLVNDYEYKVMVFGIEGDAEYTRSVIEAVVNQALASLKVYRKSEEYQLMFSKDGVFGEHYDKTAKVRADKSYVEGYAFGASDAIKAARMESGQSGAMVLADRKKFARDAMSGISYKKTHKRATNRDYTALNAGRADGRSNHTRRSIV